MECFYRISTKVILTEGHLNEFVVLKNKKGEYELPGGGVEHGETIARSIEREVEEELIIKLYVNEADLRPIFFDTYKSRSHDIWVGFVIYKINATNLESFEKRNFENILADREENYVPYLWHLAARKTLL